MRFSSVFPACSCLLIYDMYGYYLVSDICTCCLRITAFTIVIKTCYATCWSTYKSRVLTPARTPICQYPFRPIPVSVAVSIASHYPAGPARVWCCASSVRGRTWIFFGAAGISYVCWVFLLLLFMEIGWLQLDHRAAGVAAFSLVVQNCRKNDWSKKIAINQKSCSMFVLLRLLETISPKRENC